MSRGRRVVALVAVTLTALAGCSSSPDEEQPGGEAATVAGTTTPADGAANWLVRQLSQGTVRDQERDVEDLGQAIDIALAMDELGERRLAVRAVTAAVLAEREGSTHDETGEVLPGSTAKALVLLQDQRADVGDLRRDLESVASTDPAFPGRLRNSTLDVVPPVVGQVYGARALVDADSDRAADVASFLLAQQCTAGWFRSGFAALTATGQTCDEGLRSQPDTDVTALALLVLGPVADRVEGGEGAMRRAARWLAAQQDADGLVPGGERDRPNAVTTGLAARALGAWGDEDAARAAAEALVALQLDRGLDAGAVAWDERDLAVVDTGSIGIPPPDRWRRATTQAAPALVWLDPAPGSEETP